MKIFMLLALCIVGATIFAAEKEMNDNDREFMRLLTTGGPDIRGKQGNGMLHLLAFNNYGPAITTFLGNPQFSIESKNVAGYTPLHIASINSAYEAFDHLLRAGANINTQNYAGLTPLHSAARANAVTAIRLLLEAKADTTILDNENKTAEDLANMRDPIKGCVPTGALLLKNAREKLEAEQKEE